MNEISAAVLLSTGLTAARLCAVSEGQLVNCQMERGIQHIWSPFSPSLSLVS